MCVGIDFCTEKSCLGQGRCVTSLTFKIEGPEILSKIEMIPGFPCSHHKKRCLQSKACDILGQCMFSHPAVLSNKKLASKLRMSRKLTVIANIFDEYLAKVKDKKGKK